MSRSADSTPVLKVLFVSGVQEDVDSIQSALKNGGIVARALAPTTANEVLSAITPDLDLILADPNYPLVEFSQLIKQARTVSWGDFENSFAGNPKGVPVLAIVPDASLSGSWMAQGAWGFVEKGEIDRTLQTIHQNWALVRARRLAGFTSRALLETEQRCNALIDSSTDAIAYLHEGLYVRTNPAYLELFGAEGPDDLEGLSFLDLVAPQHQGMIKDLLKRLSRGEKAPENMELEAQALDGQTFMATVEFSPATYDGERCQQMIVRKKVEEVEVSADALRELMSKDHVTGLATRQKFLEALDRATEKARNKENCYAFFILEADQYARLLGQVGLAHGDSLVKALGNRLTQALEEHLGPADKYEWLAGRLGDHQMAVLAPMASIDAANIAGNTILKHFSKTILEAAGHSIPVTVSVSGVYLEQRAEDLGTVLGKVQTLMHDIQKSGGNKMKIHDPGAGDRMVQAARQKMLDRIQKAIDTDGFLVRYQPLVALHGEMREFYELHIDLPRTEEDQGQLDWMDTAGDNGLLWEVDRWKVRKAIADIDERARLGHSTCLMVGLSAASIQDDSMVQLVSEQLAQYPALAAKGGQMLTLMLPESQISTHLKAAQAFRLKMSNLGVRVGLDEFGMGLDGGGIDPEQMLTHFSAERLRLSEKMVNGLMDAAKSAAIRKLLADVKAQNRELIAKGVENASTMSSLFNSGVHYAQGTFLAHMSSKMDHEF